MITDGDVVVKCIAEGGDPKTAIIGDLVQSKPVTIGAADNVDEALQTMKDHQVRRLPVIDKHEFVGMLAQADVTRSEGENRTGDLLEKMSE